ncbi:MAG: enoyl-CoA hydratase/isomerase family protein [Pseudomonadota bacterium]
MAEVLQRRDGAVGHITLAAPERHNALTPEMIEALRTALDTVVDGHGTRAIVLAAEGRNFCSGFSLGTLAEAPLLENPLVDLMEAVERCPLPTICALNGGVYGAGVDLALACDFRVGTPRAKAHVPAARIGAHYNGPGIRRTVARLGAQAARRIYLLAETLDADALTACGYLDRVVAEEMLGVEALRMAEDLAALAPLSVQGMKRSILAASYAAPDGEARSREDACFTSEDHAEGLRALKEKRGPVFTGR